MQNSSGKDVERSIAEVERRIELRRAQMRQHLEELSQATRERMKPWPLFAIAVFAIAGFTLARSGSARAPGGSAQATRAVGAAAKTGFLASLIAVIRMAIRLGGSPLVQSGWKFYSGRH
jgi:hypothetical protein